MEHGRAQEFNDKPQITTVINYLSAGKEPKCVPLPLPAADEWHGGTMTQRGVPYPHGPAPEVQSPENPVSGPALGLSMQAFLVAQLLALPYCSENNLSYFKNEFMKHFRYTSMKEDIPIMSKAFALSLSR